MEGLEGLSCEGAEGIWVVSSGEEDSKRCPHGSLQHPEVGMQRAVPVPAPGRRWQGTGNSTRLGQGTVRPGIREMSSPGGGQTLAQVS